MDLLIQILFCRIPTDDILTRMVETGALDERQEATVLLGFNRMFHICSNKVLMLTLGRLISKSDLNQEFMKIEDGSIKMLAIILNRMKATQVTQVTEVNLTSMEAEGANESDEVIFEAEVSMSPDIVFQCHFCEEQCSDAEDHQTHMAISHGGQPISRLNSSQIFDRISDLTAECDREICKINAKFFTSE